MRFLVFLLVVHQIFADSETGQLDSKSLASSLNGFSFEFAQKVFDHNKNNIYSPLSIEMALGMVLKAAQGNTSEAIYKMLNMDKYSNKDSIHTLFKAMLEQYKDMATREKDPRNVTLELANALMVAENYNLPESYTNALKADYEATISKENFATNGPAVMEKINKFVKERTHDLIPQILTEPLSAATVMVLLNTIYFKGFWQLEFNKHYTHNTTFYNADKSESTVEMMTRSAAVYKYYHCDDHKASIIELPYKGKFSMYVLLPDGKYDLPKLMEGWSKDKLATFIPQMKDENVKVYLPKFENKLKINLLTSFDKMGVDIRPAFTPLDPALRVDTAIHEAKIKVWEAGTEAAAVTFLSVTRTSAINRPPPIEFKADHPFAYVIRDNENGVNAFAGCVNTFH